MRKALVVQLIALTALGACQRPDDRPIGKSSTMQVGAAQVCHLRPLAKGHELKLTEYSERPLMPQTVVVSLSTSGGGWMPVAAFRGAYAPKVAITANGEVTIDIAARKSRMLREPAISDSLRYKVILHDTQTHPASFWEQRYSYLRCDNDGAHRG